ncbi:hypothetical protein [Actinoplanes sp. G11-F43]|uniref:hypothetical protein n=1 Tax=Actinoplanes sp. G11-F43 TaxID=3424130 RepID=UPI003D358F8D
MLQHRLIAAVEQRCHQDGRLAAALTYGSFVTGEADAHSDIEFWLFFTTMPDPYEWIRSIGSSRHVVVNEFGAHVAFFPGLIRGEFHFAPEDDIASVADWPARGAPVDRMIVLDRTGALRRALDSLPEQPDVPGSLGSVGEVCGRFANWLILAHQVSLRGERLRSADALAHARRHLLWMARLVTGHTEHWLTPSRAAETDLPSEEVAALHGATTPAEMWIVGRRYWRILAGPAAVPEALFTELDEALSPS